MTNALFRVHSITHASSNWDDQRLAWSDLASGIISDGTFDPLTIKALYVAGLIGDLCSAVNILLAPQNSTVTTFYPAYAIFASTVELLGRCVTGNDTEHRNRKDLTSGFQWLADSSIETYTSISDDHVLIRTINFPYTIKELKAMRHFAAHGQAVMQTKDFKFDYDFDPLVLGQFPPILANAMEAYLSQLTTSEALSANLATASILPLQSQPILEAAWTLMSSKESFPAIVAKAIGRMDWSYKSPLSRLGKIPNAA